MTNLERLSQDKKDKVLLAFVKRAGVEALVENATFNRGDFFEMALTKKPVKRNGLHGISKGDATFKGLRVEIKYLSTKTGASLDMQGTLATHYLVGFNNGETIQIRLIKKEELVTTLDGKRLKITYQNNINKGVRIK